MRFWWNTRYMFCFLHMFCSAFYNFYTCGFGSPVWSCHCYLEDKRYKRPLRFFIFQYIRVRTVCTQRWGRACQYSEYTSNFCTHVLTFSRSLVPCLPTTYPPLVHYSSSHSFLSIVERRYIFNIVHWLQLKHIPARGQISLEALLLLTLS